MSKPSRDSELETQCLFGEKVLILKNFESWCYCKLFTDNYEGWVKKQDLGEMKSATHRIITNRSFVYEISSEKSLPIFYLPLGSQISVESFSNYWAKITLPNQYKIINGFIPKNHLVPINHILEDWVIVAENLVETPYIWGGRDTLGLDCSALLQLSCQTNGKYLPRNTIDQLNINGEIITNINDLKRGSVVFWSRHVGIMKNDRICIHANAFHMKTVEEPLTNIISRLAAQNDIIKMINF